MLRRPLVILKLLIGTTLWFAICGSTVIAELPHEKLDRLADQIEKALDASPAPRTDLAPAAQPNHSRMLLKSLRSASERDDLAQAESALEQLAAYLESKSLRTECEKTATEIRAVRVAKDKQAADAIEATLNRATESIRSAKKPSDLDATLSELKKLRLQQRSDLVSSGENGGFSQIEPAIRFVTAWQDYLAQTTARDVKAAQETLGRLMQITEVNLIPRSEILERRYYVAPAPSPTAAPSAAAASKWEPKHELKTLDDLLPFMDEVTTAFNTPGVVAEAERAAVDRFHNALVEIFTVYQEFNAGLPTKLVIADPSKDEYGSLTAGIRAELMKLVLPRYLGAPPNVKANVDEGVQEFLQRVLAYAVRKEDFLLAARARDTQMLLRDGKTPDWKENSEAALYVTAHNQELAGQYALAVSSYERALASGTDLIPPKVIGERLAKIKADHPQEFAEGVTAFLTPRLPVMPPGFPYGSFGPQRPSGPPGGPGPTPPPALFVPAASPGPAGSQSPGASPNPTAKP